MGIIFLYLALQSIPPSWPCDAGHPLWYYENVKKTIHLFIHPLTIWPNHSALDLSPLPLTGSQSLPICICH